MAPGRAGDCRRAAGAVPPRLAPPSGDPLLPAPTGVAEDIAVARLNMGQHERLAADPPDLAVWGEGALDPGASGDPATLAAVRAVIARMGAPTLAGIHAPPRPTDPLSRRRPATTAWESPSRPTASALAPRWWSL